MYERELSSWRNLMEDGTQCLGEEQYINAEKYYSQALILAHQFSVPELTAFTLRLLATVRVRLGYLELAEEGFQSALLICQGIQNAKGMSEAWAGLASVSVKRGKFKAAADEYEQAIAIYPATSPPLRLGMLYADLGQVHATLAEWNKARDAYSEAQEICRANGFLKGEGELDVLIGELCFRQKKKEEASKSLQHACQVFFEISDIVALTNALQYLALMYFEQNKMRLAFECQQKAVALCLRFDKKHVFSESCFFLSRIEQSLDLLEEAKYYLELSVQFYPEQDIELALRYQGMANLLHLTADYAKAELYYLKALSLYESLGDELHIGEVCEALVVLKESREKGDEGRESKEEPGIQAKMSGGFPLEALVRLAEFYEERRNYRNALECYWRALEMGRDAQITTNWIEARVQKVSKQIRRKRSAY
ncbi:tetratricopeptide repeat protein [Desulfosporosinus sp. PR]|uniref:tetratricopeptide repeat protein n=1 Tax=Candidatus Desulfosporosinus nitrosoreducens TaxID=3401928 RepID=UPI0027FF747B|nr:tetratricopeptide repeat protein [Desulfosporosinus sp. PR]MDQ7093974.1 tetratricopeptide repeat protein [Desulfosporosinus sp. PR]